MKKLKWPLIILVVLSLIYTAVVWIVPSRFDKQLNKTINPSPYIVSNEALDLYRSLDFVADLHCDALLWDRDLTQKHEYGHVDFPRMQEVNMAFQAFTIVTKSPKGQNFRKNTGDTFDNITMLNVLQASPISNWFSLAERAVHQSRQLHEFVEEYDQNFLVVKSQADLKELIERRKKDLGVAGGMLGIEGAHCLEGEMENLEKLYAEGVRMIGPTHFFDNELGGSAHGMDKGGLTDFGKEVIQRMDALEMIIDLAHASPALIDDVLELTQRPVLVSHTGVKGTVDNIRNLSDAHVRRIADNGGLIGVGFFEGAVSEPLTQGIVDAMKHIKNIAGVECIALGSDYDGSATVPFDITGLPLLVEEMQAQGFSEDEIRAIMGENVKRFMLQNLPAS